MRRTVGQRHRCQTGSVRRVRSLPLDPAFTDPSSLFSWSRMERPVQTKCLLSSGAVIEISGGRYGLHGIRWGAFYHRTNIVPISLGPATPWHNRKLVSDCSRRR